MTNPVWEMGLHHNDPFFYTLQEEFDNWGIKLVHFIAEN